MNILRTALLAIALPATAFAGIPTEQELSCPVGGEKFAITGTLSCTTFGPALLSLAPQSSCDFVTRLAQCPTNRLPVYKTFSEDEIGVLEGVVGSPGYEEIADAHSRFYLAWWLAGQIGDDDPRGRFFLLLQGLWWDTGRVTADPVHLAAARGELERLMPEVAEDEAAVYLGIGAYLSVLMGDFEAARGWLARAETAQAGVANDLAANYIEALGKCIETGDPGSALCAPRLDR